MNGSQILFSFSRSCMHDAHCRQTGGSVKHCIPGSVHQLTIFTTCSASAPTFPGIFGDAVNGIQTKRNHT